MYFSIADKAQPEVPDWLQILALLSSVEKKLMLKELGSVSSVRANNFLFCILLILTASGGR